jgi:hypothetical protein
MPPRFDTDISNHNAPPSNEQLDSREKYAQKFESKDPDNTGNQGHVYFLEVLRELCIRFGRTVQVRGTRSLSQRNEMETKTVVLTTIFEVQTMLLGETKGYRILEAPLAFATTSK